VATPPGITFGSGCLDQRIQFQLAVLVSRCLHGLAPSYLDDDFHRLADVACGQRSRLLCSSQRRTFPLLATARSMWLPRGHGLEQFTGRRHVVTVAVNVQASPQDSSIRSLEAIPEASRDSFISPRLASLSSSCAVSLQSFDFTPP